MPEIRIPARLYRAGAVERAGAPADPAVEDDRRIRLSFSSEAEVERWFGFEVLGHRDGEVDLSRLAAGTVISLAPELPRGSSGLPEGRSGPGRPCPPI